MSDTREILERRFGRLRSHLSALRDYKAIIVRMVAERDVFSAEVFSGLRPEEKAVFDAFLKRFASIQDYLGAKIFPLALEAAGISAARMTEVLQEVEREGVVEDLDEWLELRELRNGLEHDYAQDLASALADLRRCVEKAAVLEACCERANAFIERGRR